MGGWWEGEWVVVDLLMCGCGWGGDGIKMQGNSCSNKVVGFLRSCQLYIITAQCYLKSLFEFESLL